MPPVSPLTPTAPAGEPIGASPWRDDAQRRQLTIMFCDLVGSTEIAQRIDPEEYGNLIWGYRKTCSRIINDAGGLVDRFVGDGILACFGYPEVHEDDPARACRAGLAIIDAIQLQRSPLALQVRIACATGLVVVGDMIGENVAEENSILGATPNLAARLQSCAVPGTLVITDETRTLIGRLFEVKSLGLQELKGIPNQVHAWEVLRFESRFAARYEESRVRFIGRRHELEVLLNCWRLAERGAGQLACISGEPGIGKSRLVHALREEIADQPCTTLVYQCAAQYSSSVLRPVISQIEYAAKIALRDSPTERLSKLEDLLDLRRPDDETLVQLLAELMGIATTGRYEQLALSPQQRKARILAALFGRLAQLSALRPVLLVIEDIHWIDPTTRELIEYTISHFRELRVLIVLTSRIDREFGLHSGTASTNLSLARLSHVDAVELVSALTKGKAIPMEILNAIVARAEGVPLFIEEVTMTVLNSQLLLERDEEFVLARDMPALTIPTTLHDSLVARLEPLNSGKEVAQLAAVLGRSFPYALIAQLSQFPEDELRKSLHQLEAADLLVATGCPPEAVYTFKHALIQDAAYEGLLHSRRRDIHQRVAAVLDTNFHQLVDAQPELLAHHLTLAGRFADAARQWCKAGVLATERSANQEASVHFRTGLTTLDQIPVADRNPQLELEMLLRSAGALRATHGYAATEIGPLSERALDLARVLRSSDGELQAISGLYSFHLLRSEYASAEKAAKQLLEVATSAAQPNYVMVAHRALGVVSFYFGQLKRAEQSLQKALDLYDAEAHASLTAVYGADHAEMCACFLSQTKWVLGEVQDAIDLQSWAVEHARSIKHAHSIAQALVYRSFLYCLSGNAQCIEADGQGALTIAKEYGLKLMEVFAESTLSVARVLREPSIDRVTALSGAVDRLHSLAPNALRPYLLSVIADFYGRCGTPERGLALVEDADEVVRLTGECWAKAEIDRVKGLLLTYTGEHQLAETCFRQALETAQAQDARSWMRRCAADLALLLRQMGRADEEQALSSFGETKNDHAL